MDPTTVAQVIFYFFAVLTVASAAIVVFSSSLIYSAFGLLFTFFGVAAPRKTYSAATQLVIYVGGILILLLFGVMLTHKLYDLDLKTETFQFFPGFLVMAAVLLTLTGVISKTQWVSRGERPLNPTTIAIGLLFMREYILPFEVASVFLLVALIGAAMIVRRRRS